MASTKSSDRDERFSALFERHRGIVFKVANTYCRNSADRDDLAQEIATQSWRAFDKFDSSRAFSTWMYRIALNVAISFARSRRLRERYTVTLDEDYDVADASDGGDEADDRARLLHQFIEELDQFDRALLLLYLDEHSYHDIAGVLGITETNVATKIGRLKERFAKRFSAT